MARPWTMRKLVDQVVELLGTSPDDIDGGNLTFFQGPLHSLLWIRKDRRDKTLFGWSVTTYDTALSGPMAEFGGMSIRIDHPGPSGEATSKNVPPPACYRWPTVGTPLAADAAAAFTRYGNASLTFVRDRHDLGILLLAEQNVHRNGVWSFAPTNNEPARVAQAVLLARCSADRSLEQAAMTKLADNGERLIDPRSGYLFRQAVANWATKYAKATGVDLSDLTRLSKTPI